MLFISCWFHCATQNSPWSFCRLPVVVDTYSNNISIQTSSGKYVCWKKIGWCFQTRKAFGFLDVSGYLYYYLYLLILMVKRWLGHSSFQWWIHNSWRTESSACWYSCLGVTNIPSSKTVNRLSNPVCLDYGYTRGLRTVWKYAYGFHILSMTCWFWCVCVWACVSVCVNMHECTHAKWAFRESRLHKAWRRTEQEEAAGPLSDLWSRLCASRRESLVWGHSRGGKKDAIEVGFMCLEKREFCPTSIILITVCCNLWLYVDDYHTGLSSYTVDIK